MRWRTLGCWLVTIGAFVVGASGLFADDVGVEAERAIRAARQSILSSRQRQPPDVRAAVVRKLADYPVVATARLLVLQGLTSSEPKLRLAAYETLLTLLDDPAIRELLRETLATDLKRREVGPRTYGTLAVLLAADGPGMAQELDQLLAPNAVAPVICRQVLILLADECGARGDDAALAVLVRLTRLQRCQEDFAVRRAVAQAVMQIGSPAAVAALISMLDSASGEVRADIARHLETVSGQQFDAPRDWQAWWREHEDTFAIPPPGGLRPVPARPAAFRDAPQYYDLALTANRIVFVIDISGSMEGPRIIRAKDELKRAIATLPADVAFNVLAFGSRVAAWQKQLRPATVRSKQDAQQFVSYLSANTNTATFDALEAALKFEPEAVYLLTDGMPTHGHVMHPVDIVRVVTGVNRFHRATINTIGIGLDSQGGLFDDFLRTLAAQNFGQYHRVDQ